MNAKMQSLMEKVARLRALAANASTPGEAEAAAAQAAAIIVKYQLDEAQIEAADPARAEVVGEGDPLHVSKRLDTWTGILANGLSTMHGCACIVHRTDGGSVYRIAGRPSDVAMVRYLFAWLVAEIARLAAMERGRAAINAFRVGAAQGALNAMRRARAGEVQTTSGGQEAAMVLVRHSDESDSYLRKILGGTIRTAKGRVSDVDAKLRGYEAGGTLTPRAGIGSGGAPLALGPARR